MTIEQIPVLNVTETPIKLEVDLDLVDDIDSLDPATIYQIPFKTYLDHKNYNKDKYKMCEICIKEQKLKYNGRTPIECSGLKDFKEVVSSRYNKEELEAVEEHLEELSKEERDLLEGQFSPTEWFKNNITDIETYKERWYQTMITSCSAKKRVLRMGRRCIEAHEPVMLASGKEIPIKDIKEGDKVASYRKNKVVYNRVSKVINNGIKDLYEISLDNGKFITLTKNHPILTKRGWLSIEDGITKEDEIIYLPSRSSKRFRVAPIQNIKRLEAEGQVYDIEVENDSNFLVNGIVTHNCGKTFSACMYVLHRIATADRPIEVLVVAPMQTQLDEITQTIKGLCDALTNNIWERKKSSPIIEITFTNGSIMKCIVGANDGTAARGKKADILWVDETDFVPSKALEALKPIEMDNPNVEIIYTSTPIGEGNLYRYAKSEDIKEFHYPSYVIPHYNEQIHSSNKTDLNEVVFVQEILALFGIDELGVFPVRFIDKAETLNIPQMMNEAYVLNNREKFIIIIGVDWNHDNNGTRIVVLAYHKEVDRLFVVEKQKISKLNYTQALSEEKVKDLNRKYHADHVGADLGFGAAQIANLRLFGKSMYGKVPHDHPDVKLVKMEQVEFGSVLEIRDPIKPKEVLKKKTKQFIVDNTLRYFEEDRIALDDIEDNELILQLKNYAIVKQTQTGYVYKPRDKKIGDHDLDAFMIALHVFEKFYGNSLNLNGPITNSTAYLPLGEQPFKSPRTQIEAVTFGSTPTNNKRKRFKPRRKW